jgi:hypothetical protein
MKRDSFENVSPLDILLPHSPIEGFFADGIAPAPAPQQMDSFGSHDSTGSLKQQASGLLFTLRYVQGNLVHTLCPLPASIVSCAIQFH